MADPPPSTAPQQSEPDTTSQTPQPPPPTSVAPQQQQQPSTLSDPNPNPNPNPIPIPTPNPLLAPLPTSITSYPPPPQLISGASVPSPFHSFRPMPQYAPLPNFQNPSVSVPPPGVAAVPGASSVPVAPVPSPMMPHNPALRPPFAPLPNGYAVPQGTMPPPGIPRYPSPYPAIVRPLFPPRPAGAPGLVPVAPRPLIPGIPGVRPVISPIRPAVPSVTPAEKPQTTVYVGKIAPTVENDFMLSVLQLCGLVKSWKFAQNPSDTTSRGFGFCEFESAEGVLRALRLLNKFNIDGKELMLNVNQATKEYLERYVEKKTKNAKNLKDAQAAGDDKEEGSTPTVHRNEPLKTSVGDSSNEGGKENKEDTGDNANFGIVTDEDKQGDREALDKLSSLIEERLKTKPLPPPPPPPPPQMLADVSGNLTSELQAKSKADSDADAMKIDASVDQNDGETNSDNKTASEQDRHETNSPDRNRRYDRRSRERERERDVKRDKEREIERLEREAERERVRKEREQRRKIEEAEREYEERLRDWEYREREKEKQRQYEKEKEKERERKRRKEIFNDEEDEDDDDSRKRWRRSTLEEKRRKRFREKEDDLADRLKEEEEIAEAQRKAEEQILRQQERDALKIVSDNALNGGEKPVLDEEVDEKVDLVIRQASEDNHTGDVTLRNGNVDELGSSMAESDVQQSGNAPTKKLGFGLVGSGRRTAVPSVFNEEDDDEANKDKKMRPLVPIDYSTEELQAVQSSPVAAPNLIAAAEYAKRISNANPKEEKLETGRDKSRRSHDRSSRRDRDRKDEDNVRSRDENKDKNNEEREREQRVEKVKAPDTQRLWDAKQLIDMIPKTKEELFSYEINWAIYDKHQLQERMRPWISKKITEFLGEEEATLVDFIVSSTSEHVTASQMLELLQSILDEEAEMFVLKMWRMLIFEIKKVETGLHLRSKS